MDFSKVIGNLRNRGYSVHEFSTAEEASRWIDGEIDGCTVGFGGSETLTEMGLYDILSTHNTVYSHHVPKDGMTTGELRAAASGADIYLSSVNGLSEDGEIINIDEEVLKKGDEVDAIVLLVDPENQRISLGMKQLTVDPWEEIDSLFKVGDLVTGKVSKITNYGAFIELQNDIDGLVHISQISEDHVEKIKNHLKVGDEVKARVVKIDRDERRIGLSIKAAQYDAEKLAEEVAAFEKIRKDQDLTSLGDLLDEATK